MPRLLRPSVLLLAVVLCVLSAARPQGDTARPDVLSPEAMRSDLQAMLDTFEAVHPDLYDRTSRRQMQRRIDAVRASLDTTMSRRDFYVRLARLAAAFDDGHTRVAFPQDAYVRAARSGTRTFPFRVRPVQGGLAVTRSCAADASLPDDARLVSINGLRADDLLRAVEQVVAGSLVYRRAAASEQFPYLLWAHGVEAPFRVTYAVTQPSGIERRRAVTLPGIGFGRVRACLGSNAAPPFAFDRLGDVGVLTLRRLAEPVRFERFLRSVADSLARAPVEGLVVDLRGNEGGRTQVARMMLGALTDRPVRLNARKAWKVSAPFKDYIRRRGKTDELDAYLRQKNGRTITIRYDAERPPDVPLRYRGPVAVLVGPRTFSSAVTLASALQAYDVGRVFGNETGGRVNRFGDGYPFRLPETGLQALVSSAALVQASGDARARGGVRPDVVVRPVAKAGSRRASGWETDRTLGAALAWLRGR